MELDNCYARDKVHFPYKEVYTVESFALAGSWSPLSPQESNLVKSKGVSVTDFITHDVSCDPTSDPKQDTAVYQNAFSEPFILCLNNFKENDTSRPALPLSEILYQGYEEVILEKVDPPSPSPAPKDAVASAPIGEKPDLTKLKYIWQMTVVNPVTKLVIDACLAHSDGTKTVFVNGEHDYFLLLGTPNLGTMQRLLIDHADALGRKKIEKIELFKLGGTYKAICVTLSD